MKILPDETINLCSVLKLAIMDTEDGIGTEQIVQHHLDGVLCPPVVITLPG
jgi:hypothetical protein